VGSRLTGGKPEFGRKVKMSKENGKISKIKLSKDNRRMSKENGKISKIKLSKDNRKMSKGKSIDK
jgi:hypothetical protein